MKINILRRKSEEEKEVRERIRKLNNRRRTLRRCEKNMIKEFMETDINDKEAMKQALIHIKACASMVTKTDEEIKRLKETI